MVAAEVVKSQFYLSFGRSNFISCEKVAAAHSKSQFYVSFLAIEPHFVRKGCRRTLVHTRNFTSAFGDRTSFRAKGLPSARFAKSQFYLRVWRSNLISCEKRCRRTLVQLAILPQFLAIEPGFVRKGLRFVPSRWHCPAPSREK